MPAAVYGILFERIDNQVKIHMNNAQVWDSGVIHYDPPLSTFVNMDQFCMPGTNPTRIEIWNTPQTAHNPWRIRYTIYINGKPAGTVETGSSISDPTGGLKKAFAHNFNWPYRDGGPSVM